MKNNKAYKQGIPKSFRMFPSDPAWSLDDSFFNNQGFNNSGFYLQYNWIIELLCLSKLNRFLS